MNFSPIAIVTGGNTYTFNPFDRGAKGAFVYRESGPSVNAQRIVASTVTNDTASDRYSFQLNAPRLDVPVEGCCPTERNVLLGTDLVAVDMRFLASTSAADRGLQIDKVIALLEEMKPTVKSREKIYS